jgi:hypothetical protein
LYDAICAGIAAVETLAGRERNNVNPAVSGRTPAMAAKLPSARSRDFVSKVGHRTAL